MHRVSSILAAAACLVIVSSGLPAAVWADGGKKQTKSERQHERAQDLRRRGTAAARSGVGYRDVYGPITTTDPDTYYALSLQIDRLAGMINTLRQAEAQRRAASRGSHPMVPPVPGGAPLASVSSVYGPDGPTKKSVRLLLEYRLMVAGNPRLKIGEIVDHGDRVTAQVVTTDGSLVDEYVVDKKTGVWRPVR